MRISYIHGICVRHDAISNSIRDEISWLLSVPDNEVRLFTYACDFRDFPFTIVNDVQDIVFDPFFQSSDIVILHFGIFYPLFNIFPVVPTCAKSLVVFHNITPREFLPVSSHEVIDKSFQQLSNITFADHVVCISEVNQEVLSSRGIKVPSTVLPLPLRSDGGPPKVKPSFVDGVSRVLFVGRLVESKGPLDLLHAVSTVMSELNEIHLEVDFVANINFSDVAIISRLRDMSDELMEKFGQRLKIAVHGDAAEAHKNQLFSRADIFVLPTRHEGFCVPILEAFGNGCRVISYDNSNLPYISGGFARLVPTGDVDLLGRELSSELGFSRSAEWISHGGYDNYCVDLSDYCRQFDPEKVRTKFLGLVDDLVDQRGEY